MILLAIWTTSQYNAFAAIIASVFIIRTHYMMLYFAYKSANNITVNEVRISYKRIVIMGLIIGKIKKNHLYYNSMNDDI